MIATVTLKDSYKGYKKSTINPAKSDVYLKITGGFMKFMMGKVFDGHDVKLGSSDTLGTIGVRGNKVFPKINEQGEIRGLAPDWGSTRKLWAADPEAKERKEVLFHLNEHTNGVRYRLVWWKGKMKVLNKSMYMLLFAKPNKRKLTQLIKDGKEYLVITKKQHNG